ncbi:MAG: BtpA/SgcQ family protein [Treponema sp.]|jgi:membrane complex biogenesis BtpA family protein|nr:BtpA/SgcQ family protein [Treponema sp.]
MSKGWIKKSFGTAKPVIAMCHFDALPGDPKYDMKKGLGWVIDRARKNLAALQKGGVDAVMFSNEFSLPYLTKVEPITQTVMARIIGELRQEIHVPYGVNVLWDAGASVELAVAVGASFVREIFTGVYASDFGLWNTNYGAVARLRSRLGAGDVRLMFNILPEASTYLGQRSLADIAKTTVFNGEPDMICVSGMKAGAVTSTEALREVVKAVPGTPVFANTGVNIKNAAEQLSIADGAVIGSTFKKNNDFFDMVDQEKVARLMDAVRAARK